MDKLKRTFLSIDFFPEITEIISSYCKKIKVLKGIKIVPPEQIHITVKFYGDIRINIIDNLILYFEKQLIINSFPIFLKGIGAFPHQKNPKVIWIGIHDEKGEIKRIFLECEKFHEELKIPLDTRPFSPHLTIARVKPYFYDYSILNDFFSQPFPALETKPKSIILYESELRKDGPVYTPLWEKKLADISR